MFVYGAEFDAGAAMGFGGGEAGALKVGDAAFEVELELVGDLGLALRAVQERIEEGTKLRFHGSLLRWVGRLLCANHFAMLETYSWRRASMGSVWDARRAGPQPESRATMSSRRAEPVRISGISWGEAVEHGADEAGEQECCSEAGGYAEDGEPGGFAEDHAEHLAGLRAEGHADADFAGAAGYVVGHEAVDADAGEDEGEDAEGSGEHGEGFLLGDGCVDLSLLRADVADGKIGVDVGYGCADLR